MAKASIAKKFTVSAASAAVLGVMSLGAQANETDIDFGGFVKLDMIVSDYTDGQAPSSGSIARQQYIPSLTPVGGEGDDMVTDFHARQSRFFLTTDTELDNGETLTGHIEMDFMLTPDGDQRISNSYNPRLRHAFLKYGKWTFGQTWSNFQDLNILAESVDFIGITDGIIFNRQAQIRYTSGGFSASIENPETTVTPVGGGRIISSDGFAPDVTFKYTGKTDNLTWQASALLRQLTYDVSQTGDDETTFGYGVSFGAKYTFGMDDIRASVTTGSGLGRYLGLNTWNGAYIDSNGELEAIDSTGVSFAYRHFWSEKLRSNVVYSRGWADNDGEVLALAGDMTEYTQRLAFNLMYSPASNLTFGAEISKANRETEASVDGDLNRLQLMAMYKF
ncbi:MULTISPECIES: DcaP family trimeric outer membrane transporter [Idiomarina]|uniref:DcaP family trimeric outer membrane transporter n=1 Tax=Idiomarina TaxID=135575 RepID=UPI000C591598|nr:MULTISPECIES: DcaP family trimeric outer membrane transporter [Idiomarina]MBP57758.1 porin [Idiomarina sp.]|tara:strand:- start:8388 stop:9560 length:1173 start_codon:yes stop_codon:yes gene_type:complete